MSFLTTAVFTKKAGMERDIDRRFLVLRDWINIIEHDEEFEEDYDGECITDMRHHGTEIEAISENLNAVEFLEKIGYYIYPSICNNKNMMHILKEKLNDDDFDEWQSIQFNRIAWCECEDAVEIINKNINDMCPIQFNNLWWSLPSNKYATNIMINYLGELDKYGWSLLSSNENAIHILEQNIDKINWKELSKNYNAIEMLKNNYDNINWNSLCENTNPEAIELLENNFDKINWTLLSSNASATKLLRNNLNLVDWNSICCNKHPQAIKILEKNQDKINWINICTNKNAIHLIEQNLNKLDDECWKNLNQNENAMNILQNNQDKIQWYVWNELHSGGFEQNSSCIFSNPSIFTYNYTEIKEIKHDINKDLIEWIWKPEHHNKWKEWQL